MKKFGFLGPASARKSTLARATSAKLKAISIDAEYVGEFATEWIRTHSAIEDMWEQYFVAMKQIELEQKIHSVDCLITDSPLPLAWMYAALLRERTTTTKDTAIFNEIQHIVSKNSRYDMLFIVPPREKPDQTKARDMKTLQPEFQNELYSVCEAVCKLMQIPFIHIDNTDTEGISAEVASIIREIINGQES
jgi:nicotinamide riboside kinase